MKKYYKIILFLLIMTMTSCGFGVTLMRDYLYIGKDSFRLEGFPLDPKIKNNKSFYFATHHQKAPDGSILTINVSDCSRGYIGTWTIINDSLFLINLDLAWDLEENEENPIAIEKLFKDNISSRGVFAYWVNDTLKSFNTKYPQVKSDLNFIVVDGLIVNSFETINEYWLRDSQRSTELNNEEEIIVEEPTESKKTFQYLWILLFGGLFWLILILYQRRNSKK